MLMRRPARIGRPGLIGTAARTAVIAGTATAVSGNVTRRQQRRADERAQPEASEAQVQAEQAAAQQAQLDARAAAPVAPPPPAAPAAAPNDVISQLERLAALKGQGILTDEEFAAQKARILGA